MAAGDVLFVKGTGGIADIGTAGGFLGHVMVVLSTPRKLQSTGFEARELMAAWPSLNLSHVVRIETLESTRAHSGLHRSEMLLKLEPGSGRFVLVGEISDAGREFTLVEDEEVQLWQSPPELRAHLRPEAMAVVLCEMKACEKSWSLSTAARAVLRSAVIAEVPQGTRGRQALLREVQDCWMAAPICTSVVVVFWQRYLSRIAKFTGQHELDLIADWMPLKADRGLPGDLVSTMRQCGWVQVDGVP